MKKLVTVFVVVVLMLTIVRPALADTVYTVQPGDTLARIAARFGVSVQAIMLANGLTNPNLIFVGQRLTIPTGSGAPAPVQPPSGETTVYTVQPGDWLARIAARFGVSVQAILNANPGINPNRIFVGQRIIIPGGGSSGQPTAPPATQPPGTSAPPPSSGSGQVYIVQRGDTLARIAARFGVSVQAILSANGMTNPNLIYVGQRLTIPGAGSGQPAPPASPPAGPMPPPPPPPATGGSFELGGHVDTFAFPDKMKYAGMTWVKKQLRWTPGMSTDAARDRINEAKSKGFKILLGIVGNPGDISGGANYDSYAAFVGEVAALGADGIEVWNEMNIDREWPTGQINPASYVELLRRAYLAIKARNPNTLVISGAPAPTGAEGAFGLDRVWNDDRYVRGLAAAGAANYMDCIGIHYNEGIISPTKTSGDPRDNFYTRYYQTMVSVYYNAFGGARKLCFTELGYLSPEGYGPLPPLFAWAANTTVAQQAQWLGEAANLAKNSGVVRLMIVWNVDFRRYDDDPMGGYAIVRPDGSCPACDQLRRVMGGR
ncbi:MAG: LysM peptidoglycan-binding domain-containing protein [Anaerolineales bacterium]|nr:LysM peptidoglycan-binding domain-containing protein [Anaerolineales bacterium]